jgi:hypothetical protein
MTLLEEQSLQSGDNLDTLLRAFYQAEMPDPWPSLEAPAPSPRLLPVRPAKKPGRNLVRSRLALAASIALLVSGSLFLSGNLREEAGPVGHTLPGANSQNDPDGLKSSQQPAPSEPGSSEGLQLIQKEDGTYILYESSPPK